MKFDYDYIIIGSGFGGSVSALRLSEKGYRVLVLEKGKRLKETDFPKTNWNLRKWFWMPAFRFFGFFKLSFFKHVTVLSGVGVGGGSLVYANTLAHPKKEFFIADSWSHLADWETELEEHYREALGRLGAAPNPRLEVGDRTLKSLAEQIGLGDQFETTNVAVFFGEPEKEVADPYFSGEGPNRSGCKFCGACMIGCRYNAKNTLDKNYLLLAQNRGAEVQAESEVYEVIPLGKGDGSEGYLVRWRSSTGFRKHKGEFSCRGVVFAGGVMGTVKLLLNLKESTLPNLSDMVGRQVRTNSESLIGVTDFSRRKNFSEGIAIGSILHTDRFSHLEPVRYPEGSGFWRLLMSPLVHGKNVWIRIAGILGDFLTHPVQNLKTYFVSDWAKHTQILLFMRTIDGTLCFKKGNVGMKSTVDKGEPPTAFIPEAKQLSEKFAKIAGGKPTVLLTETLLGIPTTAHILGGCVMGEDTSSGVIDKDNRVFGYKEMYICDGSVISANPGVNPALTITALTERAMSKIPENK